MIPTISSRCRDVARFWNTTWSAWIFWYADQGVQCPSDEDNARAIRGLFEPGFADRVLISQDVFLKMMLTRYGGFGYAYIQRHFLARLPRHGLGEADIARLMTDNPRRVFSAG